MSHPTQWTDVAGIRAAVRRRWDDGSLLRAYALRHPFPAIDVPLRTPSATDLGDYYAEARTWADAVMGGSRGGRSYDVTLGRIGGRIAGSTDVPVRAKVNSFEQAWNILGTADAADAFRSLVTSSAQLERARDWALASPTKAIELAIDWSTLLVAYQWLLEHRGSGLYLRQVSAPGVDTKFIERHRSVLASLLGVPSSSFARTLGLAAKPAMVRFRFDPDVVGTPSGFTEATFRTAELSQRKIRPSSALIIENEITYLSVPVPVGGVVLWGRGYDVEQPASLAWLEDTDVRYWGDIDTHGFAILHRVRAHLPHARSVLMDRDTLLAHEERWGHEAVPTNVALPNLGARERGLYEDLVTDRYGHGVRLEQERIDWIWAGERLGLSE
jgi:hypothetical protein